MEKKMKIAIGSDFAGYNLKCSILEHLKDCGYEAQNIESDSSRCMYASVAKQVADLVSSHKCDRGILICGTGQGMAIAANKVRGIRAALVYDIFPAVLSREHNDSNVLCTGGWMMEADKAAKVVDAWLSADYNGLYDEGKKLLSQFENER